jgi:hypothetical protein
VNVNSDVWELLWCSGPNHDQSAASVLGYNTVDTGIGTFVPAVNNGIGDIIPAGTAIRGRFDYNLKNDPDYVILSIYLNDKRMDRITSLDDGLDDRFAVLLFDNNNPETLHDLSAATTGTINTIGGVRYLEGATGKGNFYRDTGAVKPLKGTDYDAKRLNFAPALAKVNVMTIQFTKFGYKAGGSPQYYDMSGREHTLMFQFDATDNRSMMKD